MSRALTDYGPEGEGQWADGDASLGFRETTAALPLSGEKQPRPDAVTGLVIAADAWLDNRSELGKLFGIGPEDLPGTPDSALILRAYERWGDECPRHLLGDFAFAIWNPAEKSLYCARDHAGARPFYYCLRAERFVFASDIRGVLAGVQAPAELDEAYLAARLQDKAFCHEDRTFFQSVRKLRPGHSLTVRPERSAFKQNWFPEQAPPIRLPSDEDYVAAFMEIFTRAVADCVRGVDRVGAHLSGGLDSSSIAVLAARELRRQGKLPPEVFCWQPPPENEALPEDDLLLIQKVAAQEGLAPHYVRVRPEDYYRILKRDVTREPASLTLLAEEQIQQKAAALGVRVLLSGWGGDEGITFNGRGYYTELLGQGRWGRLWKECPGNRLTFLAQQLLALLLPFGSRKRLANLRKGKQPGRPGQYVHPDFARRVKPLRMKPFREFGVHRTQHLLLGLGHLPERMEAWAASGARHGIAYRYPLLDRRILEFALGLPPEQYVRSGQGRWLMRNALSGILPDEIRWNRSKHDPVRYRSAKAVVPDALARIGQTLAHRSTEPSRSVYLNMPRLIRDLTTGFDPQNPGQGQFQAALQFLDW